MTLKKKLVLREIAGETILIPVEDSTGEFNGVFTLTQTAAMIFKNIRDGLEKDKIIENICNEFDVSFDDASNDFDDFVKTLTSYGIV